MRKSIKPILSLLEAGMGQHLHWFPEDVSLTKLAETLVGLANSEGGLVLIGISPASGKLLGLKDPDTIISKVFQAALMTEPPIVIPLPISESVNDQVIIRVHVPAGLPQIYTLNGRYLGREGKHNTPIAPKLLRKKLIERGVVQIEGRVHPEATLADLDSNLIQEYTDQVRMPGDDHSHQLLIRRNCLVKVNGELRPTYAGVLLFAKEPQRWAPNAIIMAAKFSGTTLSDQFIKSEITGPLPQQLRQAETFIRENIRSVVQIKGLTREEAPEFPLEAVRELLVNAVAHRDYSNDGDSVHIHIFSNRLELHSPGLLPGPVTLSNLLEARFSRNPIIVQVLSDMGFIERLGYGLDRVVRVMSDNNLQAPSFQETAGTFRVTLSNAARSDQAPADDHLTRQARYKKLGLNPRQEQAVDFVLGNERITNREYQDLCPEVHAETLRRDLALLVKKQVLLKIGNKRGTYYILKEPLH